VAKTIEKLPAFKGSAGKWVERYLESPKDEEARAQRRREDKELLERVRPLDQRQR